jgi:hypothetical protein
LLLGKNELPIVIERESIFSATTPTSSYIRINTFPNISDQSVVDAVSNSYGINDVGAFTLTVVNPDGQADSMLKGISIVPDPAIPHLTMTYVPSVTQNNASVGYYNKPSGDSAVYCPKV